MSPVSRIRVIPFLLLSTLGAGCSGNDTTGPGGDNGLTTVEVGPSSVTLAPGDTTSLTATARTATGATVGASFNWSSRDVSVATVSSSGVVTGVAAGNTVVEAHAGDISGSATVTVVAAALAAPSNFTAISGSPDRVRLSWTDDNSAESGFEVERSLDASSGFESVGTTDSDVTELVDESVQPSTTYYYRVRAFGGGTASGFSDVVQATTLGPPDPGSPFACEREGYPCTWTEVDPSVFDESDALGDQILQMFTDGKSMAEARAWISQQAHVTDVIANDDVVRFRLHGGRPTWVFSPVGLLVPEGTAPPASRPAVEKPKRAVVGDDPKAKRALLLSPYRYTKIGAWDSNPQIEQILNGARGYQGNVDSYANTAEEQQITTEQFKGWDAYDVVHVYTHGNQICEEDRCHTVVLAGRTKRGLLLGSTDKGVDLAKVYYGEDSESLSTDFFREQYPGGLPNTIVYLSACRTTKGEDLELALAGGGGVYLGWTESVYVDTAEKASISFFQHLVSEGIPATSAFLALREGDDLTVDRPGKTGAIATLDVYHGGDDLRIREVVFPRNPLTQEDLPQDAPYPVVGQPADGNPDRVPYLIRVDGVEGDPSGFVVHVTVNGFPGDPKPLSEGEPVDLDGNVWQVRGDVPVTFDAQQGQGVDIEATVDLPEGGTSEWDESATLGNPELHFASTIEATGGLDPFVRIVSQVESDVRLAVSDDLQRLTGQDGLHYVDFIVEAAAECSTATTTQDGTLEVVDGDFTGTGGLPAVPGQVAIRIPPTISETIVVTCPDGSITVPTTQYFAAFYSFHGGRICGSENELDTALNQFVIRDWVPGSGEILASRTYDRTCSQDGVTYSENTVMELNNPATGSGG